MFGERCAEDLLIPPCGGGVGGVDEGLRVGSEDRHHLGQVAGLHRLCQLDRRDLRRGECLAVRAALCPAAARVSVASNTDDTVSAATTSNIVRDVLVIVMAVILVTGGGCRRRLLRELLRLLAPRELAARSDLPLE